MCESVCVCMCVYVCVCVCVCVCACVRACDDVQRPVTIRGNQGAAQARQWQNTRGPCRSDAHTRTVTHVHAVAPWSGTPASTGRAHQQKPRAPAHQASRCRWMPSCASQLEHSASAETFRASAAPAACCSFTPSVAADARAFASAAPASFAATRFCTAARSCATLSVLVPWPLPVSSSESSRPACTLPGMARGRSRPDACMHTRTTAQQRDHEQGHACCTLTVRSQHEAWTTRR